jgi:hypothetical protein
MAWAFLVSIFLLSVAIFINSARVNKGFPLQSGLSGICIDFLDKIYNY